jgi:hypothetical protein
VDDACARFHLIASLQLDGEISLADAEHMRVHAAACPSCRAYETGLRGLVAELRGSSIVRPRQALP